MHGVLHLGCFAFLHLAPVLDNCSLCSAYTVRCAVEQYCAQHICMWIIRFRFSHRFPPSVLCCGSEFFPVSLMFIWLEVKIVPSLFFVTLKAQCVCPQAGFFTFSCTVDETDEASYDAPVEFDFCRWMNEHEWSLKFLSHSWCRLPKRSIFVESYRVKSHWQ